VRAALLNRVAAAEQRAGQQSHQHADPHADFDEVIVQAAINRQIARQQEVAATEARRAAVPGLPATQLPTTSANGGAEPRARREPGWFVSRAREDEFIPIGAPGISMRMLFVDPRRRTVTCIMRLEAGAKLPAHVHQNSEEYMVLEGDLRVGDQLLSAGDFQRTAPGFEQADQTSPHGCLLLLTSPFE
jgi:quercetin dioxygenase-like cupin family protein